MATRFCPSVAAVKTFFLSRVFANESSGNKDTPPASRAGLKRYLGVGSAFEAREILVNPLHWFCAFWATWSIEYAEGCVTAVVVLPAWA